MAERGKAMQTILLSDTSNPALAAVAEDFVRAGDRVYCLGRAVPGAQLADDQLAALDGVALDMLVLSLPPMTAGDSDYEAVVADIQRGVLSAIACVEHALPLLRAGGKRIAVLSDPEASITLCKSDVGYAAHMAAAALNMQQKIWFNALRPEGFTFRNLCLREPSGRGMPVRAYLMRGLCYDEKEPYSHSDENRLVMRDAMRVEMPW